MEEASKAKKAKKGFMTPDRKKKLRVSYFVDYLLSYSSYCFTVRLHSQYFLPTVVTQKESCRRTQKGTGKKSRRT
jgi:hypothetical protein